jgi:hypothetical protein
LVLGSADGPSSREAVAA